MRTHACLLALACLILATAAAGPAAAQGGDSGIFPYETHVQTLPNGLKVILIPMSSDGLVAYYTVVRTGSRDEYEPGRTGFAHFFEHMMFRGTERYPADVYNEMITRMGADANAYTTDDLTAYHMGIAAEDLETAMDLESDRFQNLNYSVEQFETEAGAVYGEYRKNRTNPFFMLYEAMQRAAFKDHTYGHTTMGYEADIKNMPKMFDYSRSFFNRYYRPENVILVIAGEIDPQSTLQLVEKYYGPWKPGYVAPKIPTEKPQKSARRVDVAYEGRSLPILWLSYKAGRFDPSDKGYVAASLLAELAFGETSALYKKLVLEDQSVEFVSADLGMNRDPGLFDIYTRVKDPKNVDAIRQEIDAAIEGYRAEPPDAARLADLKSRLKYGFLMALDTPDRVASSLARIVAVTGGVEAVDQLYQTYETITPEDIREAARTVLAPERRTVGVLQGGN